MPLLAAARASAPKGELVLDAATPLIEAKVGKEMLHLRVALDQWQTVELDRAAAARLPLPFESGHDIEIGTEMLAGHVASAKLEVAGTHRAVTLATHDRVAFPGADGAIGVDLLPFATIRWRNAAAPPPTGEVRLALNYEEATGLSAPGPIPLHFSLSLPASFATAAAGSMLARTDGGRFEGVAAPVAVPFGLNRPARMLVLATPQRLAGFRVTALPVRISDYRGDNPLPADPIDQDDIVVSKRIAPQPAQSWITIAADRLSRCAEIVYDARVRTLTLHCAFDAP